MLIGESPALQIAGVDTQYECDWDKVDTTGRIYIHTSKSEEGVYRGQHKVSSRFGDQFDGIGTFVYADGKVYEGNWRNGVREGHGRLVHTNGATYTGDWKNNMANGLGVYQDHQNYKYEGQWKDDCQEG